MALLKPERIWQNNYLLNLCKAHFLTDFSSDGTMKYPCIISTLVASLFVVPVHANPSSVVYQDGLAEYACHKPAITDPKLQNATVSCLFHDDGNIAQIKHQDKFGLINKDGKLISDIRYDDISSYDDEHHTALVQIDDKYGLISTKTGKELTAVHFDKMHLFSQNRMAVSLHGKLGYIDSIGNMVIVPKYGNAYRFEDGLAIVSNDGNVKDDTYRMGVIDTTGKEILPPIYKSVSINDNLIYFADEAGYHGVMDSQGNIIIKPEYPHMDSFRHGFAVVALMRDLNGYIDETGKEVIPPQYLYAKTPVKIADKVLFIVAKRQGNKWQFGVVDKDNRVLIDFIYDHLIGIEKSNIIIANQDNHQLILNHEFKPISPHLYDDIIAFDKEIGIYQKDNKYGFIKTDGKHITEPIFDDIKPLYSQRYALSKAHTTYYGYKVCVGDKWGFVDLYGKELLPVVYDEIVNWNDNHLFIKQNHRYGRANSQGNIITPPVYEQYRPLNDGYIKAKMDDTWYLIDPTGNNLGKTSSPRYVN